MTGLEAYLDVEEREARKIDRGTLRRLVAEILREKKLLASGTGLILMGTAATLIEPRLVGYAIDEALIPKDTGLLRNLAILLLLVECVRVSAMIGHSFLFEKMGQRVMQSLRTRVFSRMQSLPITVFDKNPVGKLVTRMTNDVSSMSEMFSAGLVTIIGNFLVVVGILTWLLILDLKLGLIAGSVFPPIVFLSAHFSARLRVAYRNARSKLSSLNAFLAENILGMRVVNLFNRQGLHKKRFDQLNAWYAEAQISSIKVFAYFQPTITLGAGIAMALVIYFGGAQVLEGSLKVGVLVAYTSYVMALFQPLREIADKWNVFLSGMASAERIFSVLDWKPELTEPEMAGAAVPMRGLRGHIVFENVWFAYDGEQWVLKDFSFEIRPGMKVGVVGHTGAGKTTLISLLMRFYEPQKGRILLDGKDLREYDMRALRASIGIVQQDVFLFSGSLRENVTLWEEPEAQAMRSVERTLGKMGLDRKKGLDLQERGTNLSMGERQVLAFTRALATDPAIWILDEATANVDSESERLLEESLKDASWQKTSILIAHRLATVRNADRILVLHKGALVENGDHSELMRQNGLYARLYRYQAAMQESFQDSATAAPNNS